MVLNEVPPLRKLPVKMAESILVCSWREIIPSHLFSTEIIIFLPFYFMYTPLYTFNTRLANKPIIMALHPWKVKLSFLQQLYICCKNILWYNEDQILLGELYKNEVTSVQNCIWMNLVISLEDLSSYWNKNTILSTFLSRVRL